MKTVYQKPLKWQNGDVLYEYPLGKNVVKIMKIAAPTELKFMGFVRFINCFGLFRFHKLFGWPAQAGEVTRVETGA